MGPPPSAASASALDDSLAPATTAWILAFSSISRSRSAPAFSKSCDRTAPSFSLVTPRSSLSSSRASSGSWMWRRRTRDPASSIRSMALSGRKRSLMYCELILAAAMSASSV